MTTKKTSVKAAVRAAKSEDARSRKDLHTGTQLNGVPTWDSFVNFAHRLGVGADNVLTSGSYGFNPITRQRILLEWIHRGSWLGGQAIDIVADDMTRAGIDFKTEMDPEDQDKIERLAQTLGVWSSFNECVRWGRLYGGAIAIMLISGQDVRTPLRLETVRQNQFKGLLVLDRWMLEPSLEDLVTDLGPHLGKPRYYRIGVNAPAMRGMVIHHSRVAMRHVGIELPYSQSLIENLWGISVLERLYDRMVAFDSASTGAAQLVHKAHLRTMKVKGLRDIIAQGGKIFEGFTAWLDSVRRFQGVEGMTMIDLEDELEVQQTSAFSGVSDVIGRLGEQISGALQIPLVRLFGQSPGGLNASGESDLRTYYDGIRQQQRKGMLDGVTMVYKLMAQSEGVCLPDNFAVDFASLWQLDDTEKAEIAGKVVEAVDKAKSGGLISDQTGMRELRQSSRTTGIFTNISEEDINAADSQVQDPMDEMMLQGLMNPQGQPGEEGNGPPGLDQKPGEGEGGVPQLPGQKKPMFNKPEGAGPPRLPKPTGDHQARPGRVKVR